jgi:CheY-like chemotaxis protein
MSHISVLIVDDDLNKISTVISVIKEGLTEPISLSQASCVQEAIENLQNKEFHLLITDLSMPLKYDSQEDNNAGLSLIKNLYRRRTKANMPMYIIGLTQYEDLILDLKGVWKVLYFDSSSEVWKRSLRDLIFHIKLVKSRINVKKTETVFVEGTTDKTIIDSCLIKFYPNQAKNIYIDTIKQGAGASWVERQLFIWAKSLVLKEDEVKYIKAIGLFDNDKAGLEAIKKLENTITPNSAESKTYTIKKCGYKYSPILKSIKSKGITFPTVIEDLLSEEFWDYSKDNNWLVRRNLNHLVLEKRLELKLEEINEAKLEEIGLSRLETMIVLYKINDDNKMKFANYVASSENDNLMPIKYLIEDFLTTFKIEYR